jgi:hypothetical protein
MDETLLKTPEPTNDMTVAPLEGKKPEPEGPFSLSGSLSKYKDKLLEAFHSLRPVQAVEMLDDVVADSEPVNTLPNTAHAIIEAARTAAIDAAKDAFMHKQSMVIGSKQDPNRISMSNKPSVQNNFADKDPQTYQQMLPAAKINPQIAQKGQAFPNTMGKLANASIDPYTGLPTGNKYDALLAAGGLGVGAGLAQHQLSRHAANKELSQLASEYMHMAETSGFNRNKLRLLNQELAERGLTNRLVEAGSTGIAKARMDKVVGELGNNILKSKLRAAAPFALLGASVPILSDTIGDYL